MSPSTSDESISHNHSILSADCTRRRHRNPKNTTSHQNHPQHPQHQHHPQHPQQRNSSNSSSSSNSSNKTSTMSSSNLFHKTKHRNIWHRHRFGVWAFILGFFMASIVILAVVWRADRGYAGYASPSVASITSETSLAAYPASPASLASPVSLPGEPRVSSVSSQRGATRGTIHGPMFPMFLPMDAAISPAIVARQQDSLERETHAQEHLNEEGKIENEPNKETTSDGSDGSEEQIVIKDNTPVLCSEELDLWCPTQTKCCPKIARSKPNFMTDGDDTDDTDDTDGTIVGYTCLMTDTSRSPPGSCCDDTLEVEDIAAAASLGASTSGTGCAIGYTCADPSSLSSLSTSISGNDLETRLHCVKDPSAHPINTKGKPIENKYERVPRYRTCPATSREDVSTPYGLPIPYSASVYETNSGGSVSREASVRDEGKGFIGKLAYFSNMGAIDAGSNSEGEKSVHGDPNGVTTAVIAIHGSGRDATSYQCAMVAAIDGVASSKSEGELEELLYAAGDALEETSGSSLFNLKKSSSSFLRKERQLKDFISKEDTASVDSKLPSKEEVLVITPWFIAPEDGDVSPVASSTDQLPFLKWDDHHPISHTFRYGGESIETPIMDLDGNGGQESATISSFGAMDYLLETLCSKNRFPNLENIIVAGHSAGGQFVHRWGLSSNSWCFGDGTKSQSLTAETPSGLPKVRLVAANPRSYAYTDERRYLAPTSDIPPEEEDPTFYHRHGNDNSDEVFEFRLPNASELEQCPEYNSYLWGLEQNHNVPAPYIASNIKQLMGNAQGGKDDTSQVFQRYASRDVVYLSGERDVEHLGNQICDEDGYQGPTRRERSERFYASLQVRGREMLEDENGHGTRKENELGVSSRGRVHRRILVNNVAHDHALMFQSAEGLDGFFN